MIHKKHIKLFILIFSMFTGLWLMYIGYKGTQNVSSYEVDGSQKKKNKDLNWYSLAGIFMMSISSLVAVSSYMPNKLTDNNLQIELTTQEKKIALLIRQGMTNKQISQELFISISTVKTHINNIYKKVGVNSRSQFIDFTKNKGV